MGAPAARLLDPKQVELDGDLWLGETSRQGHAHFTTRSLGLLTNVVEFLVRWDFWDRGQRVGGGQIHASDIGWQFVPRSRPTKHGPVDFKFIPQDRRDLEPPPGDPER